VTNDVLTTTIFFRDFRRLGEERRRPILKRLRAYEQAIADIIREGQREGSIAPDLDPAMTSRAIFGMLNWTFTWYRRRGLASVHDIAALYLRVLLHGIAVDTPRPSKG
jgi:hypothetical protein